MSLLAPARRYNKVALLMIAVINEGRMGEEGGIWGQLLCLEYFPLPSKANVISSWRKHSSGTVGLQM